MGPFGKLTSKLKGQQKEASKNGKHGTDSRSDLQKEHHQILSSFRQEGVESKAEEDGSRPVHCPQISKTRNLDDKAELKGVVGAVQASNCTDLCLSKELCRTMEKGTKKPQDDSTAPRNETALVNSEQVGAGDAKIKRSWKDSKYNLNVQKSFEAFACISSPRKKSEGRLEDQGENKTKVPATVHKTEAVVRESSDLDSSSLSLSLGLNRIKTRSGPLYKDGTEGENEAIVSESKSSLKGDKAMPSVERSEKALYQRSQLESLVLKKSGDVDRSKFEAMSSNWDGEHCKTSTGATYCDADMTSKISQGKMRRKSKAESQRLQRGHSGRRLPDQMPMLGQVFSSSNSVASNTNEMVGTEPLSAHELSKVPLKSDDILEKKVPSSLLSYLTNEFDESFDMEVAGKQLDVIKEAESPTFHQPTPAVTQNRVFKKWPKDIKSFSHELGPRGGRPHDVHRPHSDNDLEELLAALRARFNTAKEEVDSELKFFAANLIEILDRNTDSFPEWKENVEDLLVLAQRCTKLSPVDFRRECESIVHELDERRQELPMGLLKQLHTRMLFILTRCTRLLQFQKETSPEEEGLHKIQQCLKGVPSVERTLSSGPGKRGKGTATTKKLLPEVLEQSARSDVGLPKLKSSKHTKRHRFALEKAKLQNQRPCSPKTGQSDANRFLNPKKSRAITCENFEVNDSNLSAKGSAIKAHEESVVTQVQGTWDQTEGKLADEDSHLASMSIPLKQAQKAPWLNWTDAEKEEPELVICRICEEEVLTSHLEPHSLRCTLADACDVQGVSLDERLRMLADNLEKIAELNTPKSNQMAADESPDGFRPFKFNSHDGSDNASPQSNDLQGKAMDSRLDDVCVSDTVSVEDLRGLSLINFKRLLGGKTDQGVASSSAGSGTPRSTLTTPRTSQLDLLWAERNSFAELEDTSQIYELAAIARDIASKSSMEEGLLDSLGSCLEELHEILARNKIAALTVETFGRRIDKILREKIYLFSGAGDMRRFDSLSGSFEDDGMSTDDGVQSFKSTPTHPSYNDRITIEDFDILKLISRGAFGRVFLAKKRATGDLFAIKVLRKIDMIRKNAVENILAERDILITVCNPFVVRFFYSFTCRENLYLVMEYLNGGDLYSLLRHMGCLHEHVARVYIAELVLALEYLHSLGVVHRDLKPDNILIAHDGHIKLTDFGLSKVGLINSTDDLSGPANGAVLMEESMFVENCGEHVLQRECRKERSAVGTPDYLAPEILLGTEHGYTADWWSVGVILFECVTGLPPFNAEHPQIIFDNILNRKIPWPHIPEEMSYDAKDLIDKLLTEDPNQRLGAKGAPEVKNHPFFKDISWDNLARQKAAFVPSPESVDDTSYFTSRHLEGYANSSPRFGDSSDCSTSCSSSNSTKAILNEGEDDCGDLADFQRNPSVEHTFNNFSFKNASQLAHMNYDILSQTGRDPAKGHSRHQSAS